MIQAPTRPFVDAGVDPRLGGLRSPRGADFCVECAPVSIYYMVKGRGAPAGWTKLPLQPRSRPNACVSCGERF